MKNLRYKLWHKLTFLRDKTPKPITSILDWIRYEILFDSKDKRHWYD